MKEFADYIYGVQLENEIASELERITGVNYIGESRGAVLNVILKILRKVPAPAKVDWSEVEKYFAKNLEIIEEAMRMEAAVDTLRRLGKIEGSQADLDAKG